MPVEGRTTLGPQPSPEEQQSRKEMFRKFGAKYRAEFLA